MMRRASRSPRGFLALALLALSSFPAKAEELKQGQLRGEVLDADTGKPLAARVYIQGENGAWFHARSAERAGSAIRYDRRQPESHAFAAHTALSPHPFVADLPPGRYTVPIERGKEYHPLMQRLTVGSHPATVQFKLKRWIDLATRGWYSGDTHVHRSLEELPTVMKAEDLT